MLKNLPKTVLLSVIFAVFMSVVAYAIPFRVSCNVYINNGTSGEAETANSFGRAYLYRPAIANESGTTILYPDTNYSYIPAGEGYPASYDVDMGLFSVLPGPLAK
jgi:hypothetical protein